MLATCCSDAAYRLDGYATVLGLDRLSHPSFRKEVGSRFGTENTAPAEPAERRNISAGIKRFLSKRHFMLLGFSLSYGAFDLTLVPSEAGPRAGNGER
jgi:hypothetical protein